MLVSKKSFVLICCNALLLCSLASALVVDARAASGSISGVVTRSSDSNPIPGVYIDAYDSNWQYVMSGYSDSSGNYSIKDPPAVLTAYRYSGDRTSTAGAAATMAAGAAAGAGVAGAGAGAVAAVVVGEGVCPAGAATCVVSVAARGFCGRFGGKSRLVMTTTATMSTIATMNRTLSIYAHS